MVVQNVSAILKDIKVTKKGINITFEDVRLQGEQLQQLASLIGEVVLVGVDIPQMGLFEDEDVNELEEEAEAETAEAEAHEEEGQFELFEGEEEATPDKAEFVPSPLLTEAETLSELGLE